ncbi:MAG: SMP-30/gluconolactonase/LRE family protein [Balneolales bacterium]
MPIDSTQAEVEFNTDAILGEGPVWDEEQEKLYWLDIISGELFRYDPASKTNTVYKIGEHVGAVSMRRKGGLVMATQSGFSFFDPDTGRITVINHPESQIKSNRFNDGKCDPQGRFWAGTMAYDISEGTGSLYCLNKDLSVDLKLAQLTIPNGLAWNGQRDQFFFIDTPTRKIFSFDYDGPSGSISNRSVIREFSVDDGFPDGMTIDTDDHLWVAMYGGSKVQRINPVSGNTVYEVHLPVPQVTSCTFGGFKFNELYITTCRENMSEQALKQAPLSGSIFKARLPFRGLASFRFDG